MSTEQPTVPEGDTYDAFRLTTKEFEDIRIKDNKSDDDIPRTYARLPTVVEALDECGPYAIYRPHQDHPALGTPKANPFRFEDNAVTGVTAIQRPIQPALRARPEDVGKYIYGMWKRGHFGEYYLTPRHGDFSTHGLQDCAWLHEAFRIFNTEADALSESERWAPTRGWYAFSISQVRRISEGLELARLYSRRLRR